MRGVLVLLVLSSVVLAASMEEAKEAYVTATVDVGQLKSEGLPYRSLEDSLAVMNESLTGLDPAELSKKAMLLNETIEGRPLALRYFALLSEAKSSGLRPNQNFTFVVEKAAWVAKRKDEAYDARDALEARRYQIEQTNETLNLTRAHDSLARASDAYENERYPEMYLLLNETRNHLEDAMAAAARERAFFQLSRRNIVAYVEDNWRGIVQAFVVLCVLGFWAFLEGRYVYAVRMQEETSRSIAAMREGAVRIQGGYYGGKIGRFRYRQNLEKLQEETRAKKAKLSVWQQKAALYRNWSLIGRFRLL